MAAEPFFFCEFIHPGREGGGLGRENGSLNVTCSAFVRSFSWP